MLPGFLSMQDGTTAISYAAMEGHSDVVQLLIQSNADVDLPDKVDFSYNSGHPQSSCFKHAFSVYII